eukprot:TRINITY_DN45464_c0_g1_i1.p1 TRINITY_DN45464_c0_g1~~TRINITY_DN45464_c0_g1_i1.p1  ORF type:complete len:376 (+),score=30.73 TRINITY_DN45464_c0_g1_i1:711-1838(+)
MKAIDKRGLNISKCHVLCIAMTPADNTAIVAGCVDGSIQMWGEKRSFGKPISVVREAHTDEVTAVKLCSDSRHMFSRSSDGSMKAWDIRKFKEAIHVWGDIPLPFLGGGSSSIGLSPNDRLVFTGVANASTPSSSSNNSLNFYSTDSFEVKHTLTFPSLSLGPVAWPQELDQLVVGCADGSILMLYDPGISRKGALLFISRMPAQPRNDPIGHKEPIFVPEDFASQNFKELRDGGLRKVNPRSSQGIVTQQKTIPPIRPSVGFRGMEVTTRETFAEQAKGDNRSRPTILDEDPVEVLRSYDALVKADPRYVDRAYKHTQPSPILDWSMEATEGEQRLDEISICPKCGLKMCCCGFMASQNEEGDQDTNNKRRKQQ